MCPQKTNFVPPQIHYSGARPEPTTNSLHTIDMPLYVYLALQNGYTIELSANAIDDFFVKFVYFEEVIWPTYAHGLANLPYQWGKLVTLSGHFKISFASKVEKISK